MLSHADESRLREVFSDALMLICRNTISFQNRLVMKAMIGLTIDGEEVPSIDCKQLLLRNEQEDKSKVPVDKKSMAIYRELDDISTKTPTVNPSEPGNVTALYSDVEQLAQNYEQKVMQCESFTVTPAQKLEPVENHIITVDAMEHTYASHEGDDEVTDVKNECENEAESFHEQNEPSEVFLPSSTYQESCENAPQQESVQAWPELSDQDGVTLSTFADETEGMVQTVIVGGDLPADYADNEEEVLVMTGMAADEASELQYLQPGETFEYNGTMYQIAAADEATGNVDAVTGSIVDEVKKENGGIKMNKGNHTKSEKPKKFLCSFCSQRFTTHWGLKIHERLHKGQFRYHCTVCGKGFTSSVNLRGHMVKHSQQKEFSCEHCGKAFTYRQSVERHQARSRGDAPCSGLKASRRPLKPKPHANLNLNPLHAHNTTSKT